MLQIFGGHRENGQNGHTQDQTHEDRKEEVKKRTEERDSLLLRAKHAIERVDELNDRIISEYELAEQERLAKR